ncbi:MAG: hypothetical protein ACYT04_30965, partial [Nostoc sp.]
MRKIALVTGLLISTVIASPALADTSVNGYYRSNGTYVEPYHRSDSNGTTYDNYSTRGNVNPYTGQSGTRNPEPNNPYSNNSSQYSYPNYSNNSSQYSYPNYSTP